CTGRRFLSYMGSLIALGKKEIFEEIERVTAYVNLGEVINRPIGTYSGGMKQRLLIAQAIMGDPKLIIMDEPTAGLDPKERVRIREKLQELSEGRMILVATHVVSDIESIAKEIVILKKGQVMAKDTVAALCKMYGDVNNLEDVYMKVFGDEAKYV
ncbi:MAG: ATP-binding cassette domain-containing protein, partial [Lachnospiraceae bacterium]|nr:ATP-binding cassette domain-containing protein [Lachnospiraceae bacterium]